MEKKAISNGENAKSANADESSPEYRRYIGAFLSGLAGKGAFSMLKAFVGWLLTNDDEAADLDCD